MSGWIVMVLLAAAVAGGLWPWMKRDAGGLQFLGAALLLALAGYAWQGRPGLAGATKAAQAEAPRPVSDLMMMRDQLLGPRDESSAKLDAAAALQARGQTREAVDLLRAASAERPRDAKLWLALADALVQHADGHLSQAAQLAYQRAADLAPNNPAPMFFYAVTLAYQGQFDASDQILQQIGTGADPQWRQMITSVRENIARQRIGQAAP